MTPDLYNLQETTGEKPYQNLYIHIEIDVTFLVVNFFGCLVITRHHAMRFWPKLEEMFLSASRSFLYVLEAFLEAIDPSLLDPKLSRNYTKDNDFHFRTCKDM